jgi:hypothetical protein
VANEIISYFEACQREGGSLQKGMNYRRGKDYSVILMSVRANAPYRDRIEDDGATLIYEGHDVPHDTKIKDPKSVDQTEYTVSGSLTEKGKFHKAAQDYKRGLRPAERCLNLWTHGKKAMVRERFSSSSYTLLIMRATVTRRAQPQKSIAELFQQPLNWKFGNEMVENV